MDMGAWVGHDTHIPHTFMAALLHATQICTDIKKLTWYIGTYQLNGHVMQRSSSFVLSGEFGGGGTLAVVVEASHENKHGGEDTCQERLAEERGRGD